MNFIEKIMGVGKPVENVEASPEQTEQEKQSDTTDNQQGIIDAVADAEPKTYTDDEITQLWENKKLEWQEEMKAKNEAYINSLPEAERLKIQQLTKDEEIANLKGELAKRDLEKVVISSLEEKNLPISIAELVQYSDEPQTMESLNKTVDIFSKALLDGINMRLRGKTPAGLGRAARSENSMTDQFAKSFSSSFK